MSLQDQLQAASASGSSAVTRPAPVLALTLLQPHNSTALIPALSSSPLPPPAPNSNSPRQLRRDPGAGSGCESDCTTHEWCDQRQPPTTHTKVRLRAQLLQAAPRGQQAWPPHPGVLPGVMLGGASWILTARSPGGGGG